MGVIPVTRESKFITVAVNTKVGNPRGSVMVAESITKSLQEFDEYIRLTGEIRNCLFYFINYIFIINGNYYQVLI